jgi:hypothetical protein
VTNDAAATNSVPLTARNVGRAKAIAPTVKPRIILSI